MKFTPVPRMRVILDIEGQPRTIGELAWSKEERRAYFQYAPEFLAAPLPLSPFHLPLNPQALAASINPFEGLHGLFNDSLPDGWGRLLLDRRLQKHGIDYQALTALDRLAAVGTTGMGALVYEPAMDTSNDMKNVDLDWFADEITKIQTEVDLVEIDTLQAAQGGSAGARPKIMIGLSPARDRLVIDYGQPLPEGYEPWMVKFQSTLDSAEIGAEEQAYALMAADAGVDMSPTTLLTTGKGNRLFATRRFDRSAKGRLHVHTISGLLHADHRLPSLDYQQILKAVAMMTRDHRDVVRMFRRMAFNVLARNRDDHARNHALIMDKTGRWTLSPAYDLTYSTGPGGEHSTTIANEGRAPQIKHMLEIARGASISEAHAKSEIEAVRAAIEAWPRHAEQAKLRKSRRIELERILKQS